MLLSSAAARCASPAPQRAPSPWETAIGICEPTSFPQVQQRDGLLRHFHRAEAGLRKRSEWLRTKTRPVRRLISSRRFDIIWQPLHTQCQRLRTMEKASNSSRTRGLNRMGFRPTFARPHAVGKSRRKPPAHGSCSDRYDRPAGCSYGRQSRQSLRTMENAAAIST